MKKLILLMTLILGFTLIGCNNVEDNNDTVVEENVDENTDQTQEPEEEIEEQPIEEEIDVVEEETAEMPEFPFTITQENIQGITPESKYADHNVKLALERGIEFDYTGRDLEDYKKAYLEEFINYRTFLQIRKDSMETLSFPELDRDNLVKKAYLQDLNQDGQVELILLIEYPEVELNTNEVLIYTFNEGEEKPTLIYKYEASVMYGADYNVFLDIGLTEDGRLFLIEEASGLYTNETTIAFLDKVPGENRVEVNNEVHKTGELEFESGTITNYSYNFSSYFGRYMPLGSADPENYEVDFQEATEEDFQSVRNLVLPTDEKILGTDYELGVDAIGEPNFDENRNLIYSGYDQNMLTEETLIESLIN